MISVKTALALAVGLLTALGAHASGKPWWVDRPFMGDATDVGLTAFVSLRCLLAIFDRDPAA